MRILLAPLDFYKEQTDKMLFDGMLDAFLHLGNEVRFYTTKEDAIAFNPELILFQGSVSPNDLTEIKKACDDCDILMFTGDVRYAPVQSLMENKSVVDAYLVPFTDKNLIGTYEAVLEKRCLFSWEAIQNWRFMQPREMMDGDIVFVGNAYETVPCDRIGLVNFLRKHCDSVCAYGSFPNEIPIRTEEVPNLYNQAFAVVCENNWSDIEGYFTPRNIGAMAAGSCPLMRWFPGIENYFTHTHDCLVYRHQFELLDQINFLRKNHDIRNYIAQNAYKSAKDKFTYIDWAKQVLTNI